MPNAAETVEAQYTAAEHLTFLPQPASRNEGQTDLVVAVYGHGIQHQSQKRRRGANPAGHRRRVSRLKGRCSLVRRARAPSPTPQPGPDTFSFVALLRLQASSIGVRSRFLHSPPSVGLALTGLVGLLMREMALTRDEVEGLIAGLLTSGEPPTGTTRLGRLAQLECGLAGPRARVRATAQLPRVVAIVTTQ